MCVSHGYVCRDCLKKRICEYLCNVNKIPGLVVVVVALRKFMLKVVYQFSYNCTSLPSSSPSPSTSNSGCVTILR